MFTQYNSLFEKKQCFGNKKDKDCPKIEPNNGVPFIGWYNTGGDTVVMQPILPPEEEETPPEPDPEPPQEEPLPPPVQESKIRYKSIFSEETGSCGCEEIDEEIEYVFPDENGNVLDLVDEIHLETEEDDEIELIESIKKTYVIRRGRKVIKFKTNKPGYKITYVNGRPKEIRMGNREKIKRKRVAKIAARTGRSSRKAAARKRKRSNAKRTW